MLLAIGIDALNTDGAILGSNFIQSIKQRQDLVCLYPGLTELAWHLVGAIEFLYQPIGETLLLDSPGGQIEDHRQWVLLVVLSTKEQIAGQLQQQGRFARAGRTQDQQFSLGCVV